MMENNKSRVELEYHLLSIIKQYDTEIIPIALSRILFHRYVTDLRNIKKTETLKMHELENQWIKEINYTINAIKQYTEEYINNINK